MYAKYDPGSAFVWLVARESTGKRSLAVGATMANPLVFKASRTFLDVLEKDQKRWARLPANMCHSFSIRTA